MGTKYEYLDNPSLSEHLYMPRTLALNPELRLGLSFEHGVTIYNVLGTYN